MTSTEWNAEGFIWTEPVVSRAASHRDRSNVVSTVNEQSRSKRDSRLCSNGYSSGSIGAKMLRRDKNGPKVRILKRPACIGNSSGLSDEKPRHSTETKHTSEEVSLPDVESSIENSQRHTDQICSDASEKFLTKVPKEKRRGKGHFKARTKTFGTEAASELEEPSDTLISKEKSLTKRKLRRRTFEEGETKTANFKHSCELIGKHLGIRAMDKRRSDPYLVGTGRSLSRIYGDRKPRLRKEPGGNSGSESREFQAVAPQAVEANLRDVVTPEDRGRQSNSSDCQYEKDEISTESNEYRRPRKGKRESDRQKRYERKKMKRNELKLLTRDDAVKLSSESMTEGCSETPSHSIYSSQEESAIAQLRDAHAGNAEFELASQSSQQKMTENVLRLLEMISQNPAQPTTDPKFVVTSVSADSAMMQPSLHRTDPSGVLESSSQDLSSHVRQPCIASKMSPEHFQCSDMSSMTYGRGIECLRHRAQPAHSAENVWFLPKVQELRRDLSGRSSPGMKQNISEGIHHRWNNAINVFGNQWFAARASWGTGLSTDRWRPVESFQSSLVKQRYSRSCALPSSRKQTHDWRDRRWNDKGKAISVRSASPRVKKQPEESSFLHDSYVARSDKDYSLTPASEKNSHGTISEEMVAVECISLNTYVEVEDGPHPCNPVSESAQLEETDSSLKKQADCTQEDVDAFVGVTLCPLENVDFQVNRVLRVIVDFLHPDGRSMQGLLGLTLCEFYRLCSFYSRVKFEHLHNLAWGKADVNLVEMLLERLVWLCRSLVVGMLAKQALLVEDHIDFARLDLDLSYYDGIDERKEIGMLFSLAEDLRGVPEVQSSDKFGWFAVCQALRDIVEAFDINDRGRLRELGVVDTAERVSERIALGMDVSADDVMTLLHDSMSSGFGEYIWLVENHPQLISSMQQLECIMDSIPLMTKCVDIRPLRRTLTVISRFLSVLSCDERDSWVSKYIGRFQSLEAGRSWLQLVRNAEKEEDLALELTVQFLFCSLKCGAEEFVGALLDKIPLEKKIMAIKSVELLPPSLHSSLIPGHCAPTEGSLYEAVQRMTEEMPLVRFKSDGVFVIGKLCEYCSVSPSRLLSEVFFPMMCSATKGKSAIAICSLVDHEVFRKEVSAGSTVSLTDLVTFTLKHYEAPTSSAYASKYLFIETVLRVANTLLHENEALKVDFNAVFDNIKSLKWYHMFVILSLFFDDAARSGVSIEYPWLHEQSTSKAAETFCEVPLILTSWPGDNSNLLEKFVIDNFEVDDADVLSHAMLLALDRSDGHLNEFLHVFASVAYKLRQEERDWDRYLLEEEFKYQDVPHAQVFDCTGISFGFFDGDCQEMGNQLDIGRGLEEAVEILSNTASVRLSSSCSVDGRRQNFLTITSPVLDVSDFSPVFIEESPRISSTAPNMYLSSESCFVTTNENFEKKRCDCREDVNMNCIICSDSGRDVTGISEAIDTEKCIATLLEEICEKLSECCAAPTQTQAADDEESRPSELDPSTVASGGDGIEDTGCLKQATSGYRGCSLDSQIEGVLALKDGETELADAETCTNSSSNWEEVVPLKEEPGSDQVMSELRTFTWALDTIEDWEDCPASVRAKVLLLALESRCTVIRKRAEQLNRNDCAE